MRKITSNPLIALLASAGLLFAAGTVTAQGQAPQPQTAPAETVEVSDQDVNNFVSAYMEVQEINQEYTQKLQSEEDPEAATGLQQEAQDKMKNAISNNDLSMSEYQQIANQAGRDEELRGQIEEALKAEVDS